MKISKITGMGIRVLKNSNAVKARESFYLLKATGITGEEIFFDKYKGTKVLIVNLASNCGFTPQYAELERMGKEQEVIVLGFPSNDFGGQEPGDDAEIARFCTSQYGVTFQLFKKGHVKGTRRMPVYEWLTEKDKNGWNNFEPQWNFYKYLVDEKGDLAAIFSAAVSPDDIRLTINGN